MTGSISNNFHASISCAVKLQMSVRRTTVLISCYSDFVDTAGNVWRWFTLGHWRWLKVFSALDSGNNFTYFRHFAFGLEWNESALLSSVFENRLRAGLVKQTMQTNSVVEQNRKEKWSESSWNHSGIAERICQRAKWKAEWVREDKSGDSEHCGDGELPCVIADKSKGNNNTIVISKQVSNTKPSRANAVEQSAWTASATGHHLRTVQTIVENVYVWLVWPRWPVSER